MSISRYLSKLGSFMNGSGQLLEAAHADGSISAAKMASGAARANFGAGAVLQAKNLFFSTIVSTTTRSFTNISGFSLNITPSSASSKILILGQASGVASAGGGYELGFRVTRNGTSVGHNTNGANFGAMSQVAMHGEGATTIPLIYLDSPATTSAITYQVQWIAGEAVTYYLNAAMGNASIDSQAYFTSGASSILLLEIAG